MRGEGGWFATERARGWGSHKNMMVGPSRICNQRCAQCSARSTKRAQSSGMPTTHIESEMHGPVRRGGEVGCH